MPPFTAVGYTLPSALRDDFELICYVMCLKSDGMAKFGAKGLFAKTVPIYFGAPNISQIINPDRIVYGNFDIINDHFSRMSRSTPPHTRCVMRPTKCPSVSPIHASDLPRFYPRLRHCHIPEEALFAARAEWHSTPS